MTPLRPPRALPRGLVAGLSHGASYPLEGLRFIGRARLWPLAALSVAINVALLVGLVVGGILVLWPYVTRAEAALRAWAGNGSFLGGLAALAAMLLGALLVAAVLAGSALLLVLVGQAVASPFLDLLSERIETLVLGTPPAPQTARRLWATLRLAFGDVLWSLLYALLAALPVMLIGLALPPLGAVLGFIVSALLVAQEFVGLSLARRLVPFRARWAALRGHRSVALGFGAACTLILAVPGLNLVLLPLAAAGGTLLFCDLEAERRGRP